MKPKTVKTAEQIADYLFNTGINRTILTKALEEYARESQKLVLEQNEVIVQLRLEQARKEGFEEGVSIKQGDFKHHFDRGVKEGHIKGFEIGRSWNGFEEGYKLGKENALEQAAKMLESQIDSSRTETYIMNLKTHAEQIRSLSTEEEK